jgi:hypothetical protein
MSKALSYALFGYGRPKHPMSFDHHNYVQSFIINVRLNRILYPGWTTVLNIDGSSYSAFRKVYDWLERQGLIVLNHQEDGEPLCLAMLWRVKTVFSYVHPTWIYDYVLCRDTDSPTTYREAQAVQQWIEEGKAVHCITDSISHNIPMMGGMIGFKPAALSAKLGINSYEELLKLDGGKIDFKRKGSDQEFLNRYVYPKVADSATEHFVKGMKETIPEGDGRHYSIPDIAVPGVDPKYKCTNDLAGHIGAAGYYPITLSFLKYEDPFREEYAQIAHQFPQLFLTNF